MDQYPRAEAYRCTNGESSKTVASYGLGRVEHSDRCRVERGCGYLGISALQARCEALHLEEMLPKLNPNQSTEPCPANKKGGMTRVINAIRRSARLGFFGSSFCFFFNIDCMNHWGQG
jgi:hypothetical protein